MVKMTLEQKKGVVKTQFRDRGYGFIVGEDGENYYFNKSGFRGSWKELTEGDRVTFELVPDGEKMKAVNVKLLGGE